MLILLIGIWTVAGFGGLPPAEYLRVL